MKLTRSSFRRTALIVAAAGMLVGSLIVATTAQAASQPATLSNPDSPAAVALVSRLGSHSAGTYVDGSTGRMVVTVTDEASAKTARAAGATVRVVRHSAAQLERAKTDLDASAAIAGTSWAADPVTNQVVVSYDSTVTGATLDKLKAAVARLGDTARLEAVEGTFSLTIAGGDAIYGGGYRCSLGFNVRVGSARGFLTAGHCGQVASTWYSDSARRNILGSNVRYSFPGNDYALVQYASNTAANPTATVNLYSGSQTISSAGTPTVGQTVYRSGSTTGRRSGQVTALNATVNYAQGTVRGLIRTTVCAQGGDSGGSLFAGSVAYGLTSGGSGNCTTGGTTFFQPVVPAMSALGVSLL